MSECVVLFVDDEQNILDGLRSRLHRLRRQWRMLFATSGAAALELMRREPVDVIVSDMRMPEMDGVALLSAVAEAYPHVVRIVLSGQSEPEAALRAVPVAHQFLAKPCEHGVLETVVKRACRLQNLVQDRSVQQVVGRIRKLPSAPGLYAQLRVALADERVDADAVAKILAQDMAMCAKVLQLVNSSFFRLARHITRIEEAVSFLGYNVIKQIVLAVEVFQAPIGSRLGRQSLVDLQTHALMVASLAGSMFADQAAREAAFVTGLLHDIGKLVLAVEFPDSQGRVARIMDEAKCPVWQAESQVYGASHAEVGGYLLGLWGLPSEVVEAVVSHHQPRRVGDAEFGLTAATHVANGLVNDLRHGGPTEGVVVAGDVDLELLAELRVLHRLPDWHALAVEQMAKWTGGDVVGQATLSCASAGA